MKDVLQSLIHSGAVEFVNAIPVMLMLMVFVQLLLQLVLHAMLQLTLIRNFKNVFHALMDV